MIGVGKRTLEKHPVLALACIRCALGIKQKLHVRFSSHDMWCHDTPKTLLVSTFSKTTVPFFNVENHVSFDQISGFGHLKARLFYHKTL